MDYAIKFTEASISDDNLNLMKHVFEMIFTQDEIPDLTIDDIDYNLEQIIQMFHSHQFEQKFQNMVFPSPEKLKKKMEEV